jgi:hypothetical protein
MLRSLDKRLRKLESSQAAELDNEKEFDPLFQLFLLAAFGYYFGDPKPTESPNAATARALGYDDDGQCTQAGRQDTEPELYVKYARANCKLFAKFGVDLANASGGETADAAKRIYAGLPVSYRTDTRLKPMHDDVWQCRTLEVGSTSRKSRVFTLDLRRHLDCTGRTYLLWGRQVIAIDENGRRQKKS